MPYLTPNTGYVLVTKEEYKQLMEKMQVALAQIELVLKGERE